MYLGYAFTFQKECQGELQYSHGATSTAGGSARLSGAFSIKADTSLCFSKSSTIRPFFSRLLKTLFHFLSATCSRGTAASRPLFVLFLLPGNLKRSFDAGRFPRKQTLK